MEGMRGLPLAPLISRGKKPMEREVTRARLRTLREVLLPTISSRRGIEG